MVERTMVEKFTVQGESESDHGFGAQDEGALGASASEAVNGEDIGGGELVEAAVDLTLIMEDIEELLNNSDELY